MADEHDHLEGLLGKLPPAALRVVEAVKARNNPPPPPVDLVEDHQPVLAPDEATLQPDLAEPALAFKYEGASSEFPEPANSNTQSADVIALPGNTFEIDNAIAKIDGAPAEARGELSDERRQLEALRTAPGGNRQVPQALLNAINTRIEAAAREQAETPQAKVDRLWGEYGKISKEVDDILEPHMTKEEKAKNEEFKRKIAAAVTKEERAAIEKEYNQFRKEVSERLSEHGTSPEEREAGQKAKPKIEELEERLIKLEKEMLKIDASKGKSTDEITQRGKTYERERLLLKKNGDIDSFQRRVQYLSDKIQEAIKDTSGEYNEADKTAGPQNNDQKFAVANADRVEAKVPASVPDNTSTLPPALDSPGV